MTSKTKNPAVRITKAQAEELNIWLNGPSAGPYPNITGMRRYWGKDACILLVGVYAYHVTTRDYCKVTGMPTTQDNEPLTLSEE